MPGERAPEPPSRSPFSTTSTLDPRAAARAAPAIPAIPPPATSRSGLTTAGLSERLVRILDRASLQSDPPSLGELLEVGLAAGAPAEPRGADAAEGHVRLVQAGRVVHVDHARPHALGEVEAAGGQARID